MHGKGGGVFLVFSEFRKMSKSYRDYREFLPESLPEPCVGRGTRNNVQLNPWQACFEQGPVDINVKAGMEKLGSNGRKCHRCRITRSQD